MVKITTSIHGMLEQVHIGVKGEVGLWRAVITQALMDAGSNSAKREMRLIKAQAISWLTSMSEDFIEVCALADMDAKYVRDASLKAIKQGCQWREYNPNSFKKPDAKSKPHVKTGKRDMLWQNREVKSMDAHIVLFPLKNRKYHNA